MGYLLSDFQHGFRARQSTVGLLLEAVHDYRPLLLSKGKVFTLFFLDLAKTFDSVPHYRLLLRLDLLGIRRDLLNYFELF